MSEQSAPVLEAPVTLPAGEAPPAAPVVTPPAAAAAPAKTALAAAEGTTPPAAGTPPAAAAPFSFNSLLKPDGSFDLTKVAELPDGPEKKFIAGQLSHMSNFDAVAKSLMHAQGLIGAKGLLPLPAHATTQEREAFNKRLSEVLGIPKDVNGYPIKRPDSIPADMWDDGYAGKIATILQKNNVPPTVMQELIAQQAEFDGARMAAMEKQQEEASKEAFAGLNKEWGDKYPSNLMLAARAARTLGLDPDKAEIGNNPEIIRALHRFSSLVSEHVLVASGNEASSGIGLQAQFDEHNASIMGQPWAKDPTAPQFQAWQQKQESLAKQLAAARQRK